MDKPLVNRVAESGLITINLENHFPSKDLVSFDLKDHLFQGLILKEKDFRTALKEHDWSAYEGKVVCIFCSTDAIIPVWAFMLTASYASMTTSDTYIGSKEAYIDQQAYAYLTQILKPVTKSIMYGEPCSTVPIYKRPLKRVR